uniref:Uncharacterized protein n=1 Tax=Leersia perrieri TaxID=77586 RepID=A0A0D9VA15_9ORYZ
MENLLLFDETASRLGFSGTPLFVRTTCASFNFARTTKIYSDALYTPSPKVIQTSNLFPFLFDR